MRNSVKHDDGTLDSHGQMLIRGGGHRTKGTKRDADLLQEDEQIELERHSEPRGRGKGRSRGRGKGRGKGRKRLQPSPERLEMEVPKKAKVSGESTTPNTPPPKEIEPKGGDTPNQKEGPPMEVEPKGVETPMVAPCAREPGKKKGPPKEVEPTGGDTPMVAPCTSEPDQKEETEDMPEGKNKTGSPPPGDTAEPKSRPKRKSKKPKVEEQEQGRYIFSF